MFAIDKLGLMKLLVDAKVGILRVQSYDTSWYGKYMENCGLMWFHGGFTGF